MKVVRVKCEGISPCLMDMMSKDTFIGLITGVRPPEIKDRPIEEKAAEKIYRDERGRIGFPARMLQSALIKAGQNVKNGSKFISTAKTTTLFDGISAKQAVARFKEGEGEVLVGTVAQLGEGIDLPKQIAPIIFFLRPGYSNPRDPTVQFEEKRYGSQRWQIWQWRVMLEALQVRGRNIRSAEDIGVTFFVSQQFRRFLFGSLPAWLQPAYRGQLNFEQCVQETLKLLG